MDTRYTDPKTGESIFMHGNHSEAEMKAELEKRRKNKPAAKSAPKIATGPSDVRRILFPNEVSAPKAADADLQALLEALVVK